MSLRTRISRIASRNPDCMTSPPDATHVLEHMYPDTTGEGVGWWEMVTIASFLAGVIPNEHLVGMLDGSAGRSEEDLAAYAEVVLGRPVTLTRHPLYVAEPVYYVTPAGGGR